MGIFSTPLICSILFILSINVKGQTIHQPSVYPDILIEFLSSIEMEPIPNEEVFNFGLYGGYGMPYVEGVFQKAGKNGRTIPLSYLLWCRKKGTENYLVYAVDNNTNLESSLMLIDSIPQSKILNHSYKTGGSLGLSKYTGSLGITLDLSNFYYLDNQIEHGPKGVLPTLDNGFIPVIEESESSIIIYYRYNERWLIYKSIDY